MLIIEIGFKRRVDERGRGDEVAFGREPARDLVYPEERGLRLLVVVFVVEDEVEFEGVELFGERGTIGRAVLVIVRSQAYLRPADLPLLLLLLLGRGGAGEEYLVGRLVDRQEISSTARGILCGRGGVEEGDFPFGGCAAAPGGEVEGCGGDEGG